MANLDASLKAPRRWSVASVLGLALALGCDEAPSQSRAASRDPWQTEVAAAVAAIEVAPAPDRSDAIDSLGMLAETLFAAASDSLADPDLAQALIQACTALARLPPESVPLDALAQFHEMYALFAAPGRSADVYPAAIALSESLLERRGVAASLGLLEQCIEATGDPTVARWLVYQASEVAREGCDFTANRHWLERFEALANEDPVARCYVFGGWSARYLQLGIPDAAYRMLSREQEAVARVTSQREVVELASLLHRIPFHLANFDFEQADELAAEVLRREPGPSRWSARAHFLQGLARTHLAWLGSGDPAAAERSLQQALQTQGITAADRIAVQLALARLYLRVGDATRARPVLEEARQGVTHHATLASHDAGQLAALEARAALLSGAPREELQAREQVLREAFTTLLAEWRKLPIRPGGMGFLHFGERRIVVTELMALTLALADDPTDGQRQAADWMLQAQGEGTLSRALGLPFEPVTDVQRLLDEGECVVTLVPSAERSFLVLIDAAQVCVEEVGGQYEFLAEARAARECVLEVEPNLLAGPSASVEEQRAGDACRALARHLFPASVHAQLTRARALRFVGQGLIEWVPVEALPVAGRPLGLEHPLSYWPSIPVGCELRRRAVRDGFPDPERAGALMVLAPALGDSSDLVLSKDEQDALVAPLPGARLLTGADATVTALTGGLGPSLALLHVFTHGAHDYEVERSATLRLAPERGDDRGLLTCEGAEALDAPPLVVLSACGAARGPLRAGDDGVGHLGSAFLSAGAHAIVSSRADLEREATLAMLTVFEREVAAGRAADEALWRARQELSAKRRWQHPFFWSTLQVLGDGSRAVFPAPGPGRGADVAASHERRWWWWSVLPAAGVLAWWGRRRRP